MKIHNAPVLLNKILGAALRKTGKEATACFESRFQLSGLNPGIYGKYQLNPNDAIEEYPISKRNTSKGSKIIFISRKGQTQ